MFSDLQETLEISFLSDVVSPVLKNSPNMFAKERKGLAVAGTRACGSRAWTCTLTGHVD